MKNKEAKPRIFFTFYPKLKRGYWRISHIPKPYKKSDLALWEKTHKIIEKLNSKISDNCKHGY